MARGHPVPMRLSGHRKTRFMDAKVFLSNVSLTPFNSFGVAACARSYSEVRDIEQLRATLQSRDPAEPLLILGGGSNLLLTQDFPGLALHIKFFGARVVGKDTHATYVEAAAGENWHSFVRWTLDRQFAGLENLSLIPGTVGATPIQNIGAYGVEMMDVFQSLQAVDVADGTVRTFDRAACNFAYRDSVFKRKLKDRYVITSVTFRLPRAAKVHLEYGEVRAELERMGCTAAAARDVSDAVCSIRRRKLPDPAVIGNAGSFFKNPIVDGDVLAHIQARHDKVPHYPAPDGKVKLAAGWLVEQCGWKGKSLGRAGVHEQHALVLVNRGGATGAEILALARAIQSSVREKFSIELEPEPVIV
ncbi:MAG: UDP-N-acetylmuramate dehydrogenase [Pseudomonadota bacterium]|nr:UDP-N-acetylmuramate dehydrogenase [Pseudomonadota bacterium]